MATAILRGPGNGSAGDGWWTCCDGTTTRLPACVRSPEDVAVGFDDLFGTLAQRQRLGGASAVSGNREDKPRAGSVRSGVLHPDAAAMRRHDVACDRQPQTQAAVGAPPD